MKPQTYTVKFLLLGALLFGLSGLAAANSQAKNLANHRGGQASDHMSPKGSANSNAQWSADPTRGWVRADERHELTKPSAPAKPEKQKQKYKAKAKGH